MQHTVAHTAVGGPMGQDAEVAKRGIVAVEPGSGRVTDFWEKPSPTEVASRFACPAVYVLRNSSLPLVGEYLASPAVQGNREAADAPGRLIAWLCRCVGEAAPRSFPLRRACHWQRACARRVLT